MNEIISQAEALTGCLGDDGLLKAKALSSLKQARQMAERSDDPEQYAGPFPAFFCLIVRHDEADLRALQEDFRIVHANTRPEKRGELESFWLKDHNEFHGGLFDMRVKAALLSGLGGDCVTLDHQPPGGERECDAFLTHSGRQVAVEATVLSVCGYERESTRRALEDGARVWTSPGPYDPPGSKWPNPYYTTVRIYAKVYEKLAPKLQANACQFPEQYPGVLAISLDGVHCFPCRDETDKPFEPAVYWAFDELFLDQPWGTTTVSGIDISLTGWLQHHARDLLNSGRVKAGTESATLNELIALPRRVSAVLMFNRGRLVDSRLNYHANRRLSHAEMAALENVFADPVSYY